MEYLFYKSQYCEDYCDWDPDNQGPSVPLFIPKMHTYVVNEMPCWSLVWSLILQVKYENIEYLSENYALTKEIKK